MKLSKNKKVIFKPLRVYQKTIFQGALLNLKQSEAEVIVLADELKADLAIIDERLARKYVEKAGLKQLMIQSVKPYGNLHYSTKIKVVIKVFPLS